MIILDLKFGSRATFILLFSSMSIVTLFILTVPHYQDLTKILQPDKKSQNHGGNQKKTNYL